MPITRFFRLYRNINHLRLEEEAEGLAVTHNSKPGDRLKEIQRRLREREKPPATSMPVTMMSHVGIPGVGYEQQAGSVEALRQRQKESAERLRREYEASKTGARHS